MSGTPLGGKRKRDQKHAVSRELLPQSLQHTQRSIKGRVIRTTRKTGALVPGLPASSYRVPALQRNLRAVSPDLQTAPTWGAQHNSEVSSAGSCSLPPPVGLEQVTQGFRQAQLQNLPGQGPQNSPRQPVLLRGCPRGEELSLLRL